MTDSPQDVPPVGAETETVAEGAPSPSPEQLEDAYFAELGDYIRQALTAMRNLKIVMTVRPSPDVKAQSNQFATALHAGFLANAAHYDSVASRLLGLVETLEDYQETHKDWPTFTSVERMLPYIGKREEILQKKANAADEKRRKQAAAAAAAAVENQPPASE